MAVTRSTFAIRNARFAAGVSFLAAAALLSGCALIVPQTRSLEETWPEALAQRVELEQVPFFPQKDYQCGPAALATTLAASSVAVTPEELVREVYLPARHGSLQLEMLAAARTHGRVSYRLAPRYGDVLREVAAGNPVIVLQDYGVSFFHLWHYAVVVGYDRTKDEVVLRSGEKQRLTMPLAILEYTWRPSDYWAMVVMDPARIPATATEAAYLDAVNAMARVAPPKAAGAAYGAFLHRWPGDLTASIGLANAQHSLGELGAAEKTLRAALDAHPDSPVILNNLAQTVSDQGRHREALALIDRALAKPGEFGTQIRETRTGILARLGKSH